MPPTGWLIDRSIQHEYWPLAAGKRLYITARLGMALLRWNRQSSLVLVVLIAAFALSGWQMLSPEPAPDFAFVSPIPGEAVNKLPPQSQPASVAKPESGAKDSNKNLTFQSRFVSSSPGQAVHAPSVVELRNGDLRAVWFSGSREGARDVTIQSSVMDKETLRWSSETTLFERHRIEHGLMRYVKKIGNPVIWRGPSGDLYLWMVNVSLGGWAGSSISWARSADEGVSWTAPRRLVTSPFLNISTLVKGAPFAFANGQIGLPVYHEFVTKLGEMLRLDDQGRVIDKVRIPASHTSLQPVTLVTGAREAQVFMRSGDAIALMTSETRDAGLTWSPTRRTDVNNPDSALAGLVSRDARRWLALNPNSGDRETLSLAVLNPGASLRKDSLHPLEKSPSAAARLETEPYLDLLRRELTAHGVSNADATAYLASAKRQLCGETRCWQEFSYPYLLQSRDGHIHLVYTWHRTRIKHIRLDPSQPGLIHDVPGLN